MLCRQLNCVNSGHSLDNIYALLDTKSVYCTWGFVVWNRENWHGLGLFSVECNMCMTFNCDHARKFRVLELRSVKTAVSIHCHARFRKATVLSMSFLKIYLWHKREPGDFFQIFGTVGSLDWLPFIYWQELQLYKNY